MSLLAWTKTYRLPTKQGPFKIFVSKHDGVGFYSSLLHWNLVGERLLRAPGAETGGYIDYKLEKRMSDTEQGAMDAILDWARQQFEDVGDHILIDDSAGS